MHSFARTLLVTGALAASTLAIGAARADEPIEPPPPQPAVPPPAAPHVPVQPQHQTAKSEADGVVQLVDEALAGIDLRSEQTDALQTVATPVDEAVSAVDGARRAFLIALAEQIASGSVDASALQAQTKRVEDEAAAAEPILRRGLERVHDVLDASQRKDFVANFRRAMKKREATSETKSNVDELSNRLGLSSDQKQKIAAILDEDAAAADVVRSRVDTILGAFPADTFSMDELLPKGLARDETHRMLQRTVDKAKRVTDVLTPDQRTKAAEWIKHSASDQPAAQPGERENVGSVTQPLWAGRTSGYQRTVTYRRSSGYAFGGGYATGFGGFYLL